MIDFIFAQLGKVFDYFFAQNAPMTIMVLVIGFLFWLYLRNREISIVVPLEVASHQHELLKKQMDSSEGGLEELKSKLTGLYRHERRIGLEKTGLTMDEARFRLDQDMETHMHVLQLRGVHGCLRNGIRDFFRDNHLANKTEDEFQVYLEKRKKHLWTNLVESMSNYWFSGMSDPSRSDLYDVHEVNKDAILKIIEDIFREGRQIALEYQAKTDSRKPWRKLKEIF